MAVTLQTILILHLYTRRKNWVLKYILHKGSTIPLFDTHNLPSPEAAIVQWMLPRSIHLYRDLNLAKIWSWFTAWAWCRNYRVRFTLNSGSITFASGLLLWNYIIWRENWICSSSPTSTEDQYIVKRWSQRKIPHLQFSFL